MSGERADPFVPIGGYAVRMSRDEYEVLRAAHVQIPPPPQWLRDTWDEAETEESA